jgi:hypothetical protein
MRNDDTHVFANDSTQALNPQDTSTAELADEEAFAGEHGLAEALRLVVFDDTSRARQEGIFASTPDLLASQSDVGDVAERKRSKEELARTSVGRYRHLAASNELLHAEFDCALESHGRRHCDHGAWFGFQRSTDGQLNGHDGVAVAVADAVTSTIECAHVIHRCTRACEVALRRSASWHSRLSAGVVWTFRFFLLFLRILICRRPGVVWELLFWLLHWADPSGIVTNIAIRKWRRDRRRRSKVLLWWRSVLLLWLGLSYVLCLAGWRVVILLSVQGRRRILVLLCDS